MRRRKARTFLTCATLVLLTFTVLSFTSVVQTIRFNEVPAPSDHGPRYNGIMIRTAMWDPLQEPAYRLLTDEFGREHAVAPRAWFFGTQMGEQSFLTLQPRRQAVRRQGAGRPLARRSRSSPIPRTRCSPTTRASPSAAGSSRAMSTRRSCRTRSRRRCASIRRDVGTAKFSYSGVDYTVIGILNSAEAERVRRPGQRDRSRRSTSSP